MHGFTEDLAGRTLIEMDERRRAEEQVGEVSVEEEPPEEEQPKEEKLEEEKAKDSPIQRYRFTNPQGSQLVYYWHYALPAEEVEGLSSIQVFYQEVRKRRASITLQVFAPDAFPEESIEFVKLVDAAIQDFVGPEAVRKCNRRPLTFTEE